MREFSYPSRERGGWQDLESGEAIPLFASPNPGWSGIRRTPTHLCHEGEGVLKAQPVVRPGGKGIIAAQEAAGLGDSESGGAARQ